MFALFAFFTFFVTAVFSARTASRGESVASSLENVFRNAQSGCVWDCKIVDSDFGKQMETLISEYRLITLGLKYEQRVDEKCLSQADSVNSSTEPAGLWTWLAHGNQTHGAQNVSTERCSSTSGSFNWFRKSLEGQIKVLCSLTATKDLNDTRLASLNDVIAVVLLKEVTCRRDSTELSETELCYKGSIENGSFVCVNVTRITSENNSVSWEEQGFRILVLLVGVVSLWYFPSILCLFTPTEVKTGRGNVNIVLHGTSPVGIRSYIANFLSSHNDSLKWKLGQTLLLIIIFIGFTITENMVLDLVLTAPSLLKEIDSRINRIYILVACNAFLLIRSFVRFFCSQLSFLKPCHICETFGDKKGIVHNQVREEIEMHLRIQPSIVLRCFKQAFYLFKTSLQCRERACMRSLFSLFLVLVFPLIAAAYLVICLLTIAVIIFYSCPLSTFYDLLIFHESRRIQRVFKNPCRFAVGYFQFIAFSGMFCFVVVEIAIDLLTIIRQILMNSPTYLPYVILVVVIAYYVWRCYSSFTRKYDKLALKLYKHYKAKTQGEENDSVHCRDNTKYVIPKKLFEEACTKMKMPLRESIGILLVKIIPILTGIFIFFAVIMDTPGASDRTKAIGALFTTLLPYLVEMLFDKGSDMEKLEDEIFGDKVRCVVDEYFSNARNTTQNGSSNNNEADTRALETDEGADGELHSFNDTTPLYNYGSL